MSPEEAAYAHSIHPYIDEQASQTEAQAQDRTKDKFLYVLLAWLFENKERYEDPLRAVELIYDDFDFPESIVSFVRYKPTTQPLLATIEANIERLYSNWNNFLNEQRVKCSA